MEIRKQGLYFFPKQTQEMDYTEGYLVLQFILKVQHVTRGI